MVTVPGNLWSYVNKTHCGTNSPPPPPPANGCHVCPRWAAAHSNVITLGTLYLCSGNQHTPPLLLRGSQVSDVIVTVCYQWLLSSVVIRLQCRIRIVIYSRPRCCFSFFPFAFFPTFRKKTTAFQSEFKVHETSEDGGNGNTFQYCWTWFPISSMSDPICGDLFQVTDILLVT